MVPIGFLFLLGLGSWLDIFWRTKIKQIQDTCRVPKHFVGSLQSFLDQTRGCSLLHFDHFVHTLQTLTNWDGPRVLELLGLAQENNDT